MVIYLERGADLYMAQRLPLPLTVSCSRLVLPFWYWLTRVVLDKGPLNGCVCVCVRSYQLSHHYVSLPMMRAGPRKNLTRMWRRVLSLTTSAAVLTRRSLFLHRSVATFLVKITSRS